MKYLYYLISTIAWISGVIIAKGFWYTLFAFLIPFWAWYLTLEKILLHFNIL